VTDKERMSRVQQFFGWPVPERRSFRFRVEQGIVGFSYIEVGNRTATRWYIAKRPEIVIASSGIGTTVTRTHDESEIALRPDLLAEHVTTIALLSNRFLECKPVNNDLLIDHVGSTKALVDGQAMPFSRLSAPAAGNTGGGYDSSTGSGGSPGSTMGDDGDPAHVFYA
jgi:hypothetical protein